jgi:mRNA interferase YafQ
MKRQLVLTSKFKRTYRKLLRRDAVMAQKIGDTLINMQHDVFAAALGTHKLSGELRGLRACSCGYDRRVVFSIEPHPEGTGEVIVLLDVGRHDEVY